MDILARHLVENAKKLEESRKAAIENGKEPFDFVKFSEVYPHSRGDCKRLEPDAPLEVQEDYEEQYYMDYPEIMTVEEFAKELDRIDESY